MALVRGPAALRAMIEEIGDEIGPARLREFDRKVRAELALTNPEGGTATDWINAMARVIVRDDDTRADRGFRRGLRRIRQAAGR